MSGGIFLEKIELNGILHRTLYGKSSSQKKDAYIYQKGGAKMLTSISAANAILVRAKKDGVEITPRKLQKLLYIIYKTYLKKTGIPLFAERIEAWKSGPVVRNVYVATRKFARKPISSYLPEVDGTIYTVEEESSPIFRKIADSVWKTYGTYDQSRLTKLTRGSAWQKARKQRKDLIDDYDIISEKDFPPAG